MSEGATEDEYVEMRFAGGKTRESVENYTHLPKTRSFSFNKSSLSKRSSMNF
jgi:hypothetical protein